MINVSGSRACGELVLDDQLRRELRSGQASSSLWNYSPYGFEIDSGLVLLFVEICQVKSVQPLKAWKEGE